MLLFTRLSIAYLVAKYNPDQKLNLNEGQSMLWVDAKDLDALNMIPQDKHYLKLLFETNFKPRTT